MIFKKYWLLIYIIEKKVISIAGINKNNMFGGFSIVKPVKIKVFIRKKKIYLPDLS